MIYLGKLYYQLGDYSLAKATFEHVLQLNRQTEFHGSSLLAMVELGYVYLRLGELAYAEQSFLKSLQQFKVLGNRWGIVYALEGLASLATHRKEAIKAVRLLASVDTLRQETNLSYSPAEHAELERDRAVILGMIGEEAFNAAYTEGQAMTAEQAIALAVEDEG